MKRVKTVMHHVATLTSLMFVPVIYLVFRAIFNDVTFKEIFDDWNRHRKSGEYWRVFDEGWNE